MDAELREEEEELERNEWERCLDSQFCWILTRIHRTTKNKAIYAKFGRNRPIETVTMKRSTMDRFS